MGGPPIDAEFYELFLESKIVNGKRVFYIREKHGWWDDVKKKALVMVETLCDKEGVSTYDEAAALYEKQLKYRISNGFCHSFTPDYYGTNPLGFIHEKLSTT